MRDSGLARDYVQVRRVMLQQHQAEDFVIAPGVQHSVRQFVEFAAQEPGITMRFDGEGDREVGIVSRVDAFKGGQLAKCKVGRAFITADPRYCLPREVEPRPGDPGKATARPRWVPATTMRERVKELEGSEHAAGRLDSLVKLPQFRACDYNE